MNSNVFIMYSKPKYPGFNVEDRATIACQVVDGDIKFGISVCTAGDNFSRAKGSGLALQRMHDGYDTCQFSGGFYEQRFQGNLDKALYWFASTVLRAIEQNPRRYKNRIAAFNKEVQDRLNVATNIDAQ